MHDEEMAFEEAQSARTDGSDTVTEGPRLEANFDDLLNKLQIPHARIKGVEDLPPSPVILSVGSMKMALASLAGIGKIGFECAGRLTESLGESGLPETISKEELIGKIREHAPVLYELLWSICGCFRVDRESQIKALADSLGEMLTTLLGGKPPSNDDTDPARPE